jgi:uncharacterized protein (UPF0335 family)
MPRKKKSEGLATVGHNSVAGEQLKSYIERVEKLLDERAGVNSDIRDLYAEMKGNGFDTKVIKQLVKVRSADRAQLVEQATIFQTYAHAIGEDFSFL